MTIQINYHNSLSGVFRVGEPFCLMLVQGMVVHWFGPLQSYYSDPELRATYLP